jgi:superfamily II DNA/RNA helicase
VKNLADLGITKLTTIQARALPIILGGKDALVKSQTGSGKTLTYAVPIIQVPDDPPSSKASSYPGFRIRIRKYVRNTDL